MTEPAAQDEVTIGELSRGFGRLEKTIENGFKTVNDRIDSIRSEYVSKELYESEREALRGHHEGQIDSLNKAITEAGQLRRWWMTTGVSFVAVAGSVVSYFHH